MVWKKRQPPGCSPPCRDRQVQRQPRDPIAVVESIKALLPPLTDTLRRRSVSVLTDRTTTIRASGYDCISRLVLTVAAWSWR